MLGCSNLPRWMDALLSEKFFNACIIHENLKKNEKNIFCLDCCDSICQHCLPNHNSHRLLQIRRYVYHDVLRVEDAKKLMDCSYVQPYITNSAKVLHINPRPQTRPCRGGSGSICTTCDRGLQETFIFCSLSCKLQHILRTEGELNGYIYGREGLTFPEPGLEDGLLTPDSVLEPAGSYRTESNSSVVGCGLGCTATTEAVASKKRSGGSQAYTAACRPVVSPTADMAAAGRRKNTPHRSPLY